MKARVRLQQTSKRVVERHPDLGIGFSRTVPGSGWVLFGNIAEGGSWRWFERRFESADAARKYAVKRGWEVQEQAVAV